MYDLHRPDVQQRIVDRIGAERARAWGAPHMARNPYLQVWTQIGASQYREVPEVEPPAGAEEVAAAVVESGFWQLAQRLHRDTLAWNENFVRVDLAEGVPTYRPVFPDLVSVVCNPVRPSQPVAVNEWVQDPENPSKWVRLEVDPRSRVYRAWDDQGTDVSLRVLGGVYVGDAYPWVNPTTNEALLPYVVRHKQETGWMWDPYSGSSVVEGTLNLGVLYTAWEWIMLQASWPQRYVAGVEPAGMDVNSRDGKVTADPAVILRLMPTEDLNGQPLIGQWANAADPAAFLGAIRDYERDLVETALGGAMVSRTTSDIRSQYSLAVSREAQREAQQVYEPQARRADLQLLSLTAALLGAPTAGWRIRYRPLPRDPSEMQAEMDRMAKLIEAGLLDKVTAYMELHPGMTRDEAEKAVKDIAETNRRIA